MTAKQADLIPVVIYARCSTDEQTASVPDQLAAWRREAPRHGYRIVREYRDEGLSGSKDIAKRVAFHQMIGGARKEARLRWLQQYWTSKVRGKPGITVQTPADPARSCAIANVTVAGKAPADLARELFEQHRVYTVAINRPEAGILGVRVTPHLFTTTADLDMLVKGLVALAA